MPVSENTDIYMLNPNYDLKVDKNRVVITNRSSDPTINNFIGFIHPVFALILSLFDGEKTFPEVLGNIAAILKKERSAAEKIITPLLENETEYHFDFDDYHFSFPVNILVKKSKHGGRAAKRYDVESFLIPKKDLDMETWRLHRPLDTLFMINTRCLTDCVYCYADRGTVMDCKIPLARLKELIKEAKSIGVRTFDITGGELFLYPHWEELLTELVNSGFYPYISTKCPLTRETLEKLKKIGIKRIQVSIDSVVADEMKVMLKVGGDYCQKMQETLRLLDEHGFDIFTNSQVTSINQGNIHLLIDFLLSLRKIKSIKLGPAAFSLYRKEQAYMAYRANIGKIKKIEARIDQLKEQYRDNISINFSGYIEKDKLLCVGEKKRLAFNKRARCSGNFYAFIILPDGNVTVCEELYWHPRFIIGDLKKQSIEEVWNSDKALELYNISKEMIREEGQCKKCDEFDNCHKHKGVCWKEVLYAYGEENWDYPDPKCPYAPAPFTEYYLPSIDETRN